MLFSPKIVRCYCNYLKKYSSNDLHVRMIYYNNFRSRWGGRFSIYMYILPETVQNLCNDEDYRVDNKSSLKKSKLYDTMAITKMAFKTAPTFFFLISVASLCNLTSSALASRQFLPCSRSNPLGSVQSCLDSAWDVRCKVKGRGGNTYFIRCSNRRPYPDLRCSPKSHHLDRMICCDLICPL